MNEDTLVKTMPLPYGQEWAWYGDLNLVALAPHLCPAGRERALSAVQDHWRRSCLRIVPDSGNFTGPPTEPFTIPTQAQLATLP